MSSPDSAPQPSHGKNRPSKPNTPQSRKAASPKPSLHPLRILRITTSTAVLAILAFWFLDFYHLLPTSLAATLARFQLIPSLNSSLTGLIWPGGILALAAVLLVTLLFGRVYCAMLCPFGILQDVIRALTPRKFRKPSRFSKPVPYIRPAILALCAISFAIGLNSLILPWLDPYSQFGRIFNLAARPAASAANNLLAPDSALSFLNFEGWFRTHASFPPASLALALMAIPTLVALFMAFRSGRLYCNTVCPVGAFLGLISRFSAFRVTIAKTSCNKCASCLKSCRANCIDLKSGQIDHSRCVNCFDCLSVCPRGGCKLRWQWFRKPVTPPDSPPVSPRRGSRHGLDLPAPSPLFSPPSTPGQKPGPTPDASPSSPQRPDNAQNAPQSHTPDSPPTSRREFLQSSLASASLAILASVTPKTARSVHPHAISPPGSRSVKQFTDSCTACQLCVKACPTGCLVPSTWEYGLSGMLKPRLAFHESFCNFDCTACSDVCPAGAILPITAKAKKLTRIALADFRQNECIVARDLTDCGACSEHCPTKALDMVPFNANGQSLRIPHLIPEYCIGCGACECACPVKAVTVAAIPTHQTAKELVQKPVTDPNAGSADPFPF